MNTPRNRFRRSQRLAGAGVFKSVIDARARADEGAITLHAMPGATPVTRIGISIGRRVGCAARRNRIKRLLREAYRLSQHELACAAPGPYDVVIVVKPHEPLALDAYRARLASALATLHAVWMKRAQRKASDAARPAADAAATPTDPPPSPIDPAGGSASAPGA
ncbi:MAG: ribonuclease P protein component [Planctomycetaceae bacterium]|nr:ribonuclease P protein component [Planctomycetaceae bacterium]